MQILKLKVFLNTYAGFVSKEFSLFLKKKKYMQMYVSKKGMAKQKKMNISTIYL